MLNLFIDSDYKTNTFDKAWLFVLHVYLPVFGIAEAFTVTLFDFLFAFEVMLFIQMQY